MTPALDAPVSRRRLRNELRRARIRAGFTQQDVADKMEWSLSKLVRIESGAVVRVSVTDIRALLQHYHIEDPKDVDRILALARAGRERQVWWSEYSGLNRQYQELLGYEASASQIQSFQPVLVPGVLQTEEYARAVLRASAPQNVDELVEVRMRRQEELFGRSDPPEMSFVLDESVLRRRVAGKEVMSRQLRRLKQEAAKDRITIEVVPFEKGAYRGMSEPFVILQFEDEHDEDVLFLENARGDIASRDEERDIRPYNETFAQLRDLAKDVDLEATIDRVLEGLGAPRAKVTAPGPRRDGTD
jgi:transcriptional regulator with XRE-family HTH domain